MNILDAVDRQARQQKQPHRVHIYAAGHYCGTLTGEKAKMEKDMLQLAKDTPGKTLQLYMSGNVGTIEIS